ncbi:hypothetical protein ElyMa_005427100 [Elysia marginata]|uniref:Uncharacterized protein n=1 Tax=Elysia marginata TaxID=1093978 RepID=A0AAV4EKN2_9GAST|nr:hypothetical protein ElyMa_005427100 [Elysia marginata]
MSLTSSSDTCLNFDRNLPAKDGCWTSPLDPIRFSLILQTFKVKKFRKDDGPWSCVVDGLPDIFPNNSSVTRKSSLHEPAENNLLSEIKVAAAVVVVVEVVVSVIVGVGAVVVVVIVVVVEVVVVAVIVMVVVMVMIVVVVAFSLFFVFPSFKYPYSLVPLLLNPHNLVTLFPFLKFISTSLVTFVTL